MEMQKPAVRSQTPQTAAVNKGVFRENEQAKQNGLSTQINKKK